jgi:hypothetical protein
MKLIKGLVGALLTSQPTAPTTYILRGGSDEQYMHRRLVPQQRRQSSDAVPLAPQEASTSIHGRRQYLRSRDIVR